MKVQYYGGLIGTANAKAKFYQLKEAIAKSKLAFTCQLEYKKGVWNIFVSTPYEVFDSWDDMCDYIRKLVKEYKHG